jgi:hypothetical protein
MKRVLVMTTCAALVCVGGGLRAEPAAAGHLCVGGQPTGGFATIQDAVDEPR